MIISIIVAADEGNVIGGGNKLLWSLPDDLKRFRALTKGHPVIMGRKTYESIGHPLPARRNIIVSRSMKSVPEGCEVVRSTEEAIAIFGDSPEEVFIIGGGEIYQEAMEKYLADRIYLTRVHGHFEGDAYFPGIDPTEWQEVCREEHAKDERHPFSFTFIDYERKK